MNINKVEKFNIDGFIFYRVTFSNGIISQVPNKEGNKDYQAIQEWISAGNTVIDNPLE
jgi:hypothetical protein